MLEREERVLMTLYGVSRETAAELLTELKDGKSLLALAAPLPACPKAAGTNPPPRVLSAARRESGGSFALAASATGT